MITTGINCLTSRYGTGMESCQPVEGPLDGFYLFPKGWTRNKTTDEFDNDYIDEQIQLGNVIPFTGAFQATVATPDPTTQESQTGLTSVVRQGLPVFTFTFKKGLQFHKAAFSYNSDNQYDVVLSYKSGYMKVVESVDGEDIKAITVGMLNTGGYQENDGTNSSQTVIMFQVVNEAEYNKYAYLLTDLDFDPQSKQGITNMVMNGYSVDVSDGVFIFDAVWKGNEQFPMLGLSSSTIQVVNAVTGAEVTLTGVTYNTTTKRYSAASIGYMLAATYIAKTHDTVLNVDVAKVGNKFLQGTTKAVTAVA